MLAELEALGYSEEDILDLLMANGLSKGEARRLILQERGVDVPDEYDPAEREKRTQP